MKSSQKQQKLSPQQNLLDEYLTLKPHRAVERILTQNDLGYCIELYNLLQQNVKGNTNQLRSVLYSKHENLHQCSQMIEKIQGFASKVKNIQEEIDSCLKAPLVEDDWKLGIRTELSPVQKIEQLMNEKMFSAALKQCRSALSVYNDGDSLESDPDAYYISFLKVQIIQKLEEYLRDTPLLSDIIAESISAIKQFMEICPIQSLIEYIQQSVASVSQAAINPTLTQNENVGILQLLYEIAHESSLQEKSYPLSEDQVIQVIFKFKLLSIKQSSVLDNYENPQHKISHLYDKVFNYFSDLLQILDQVQKKYLKEKKSSNGTQANDKRAKLYKIFTLNIQKAVNHISELFITNQKGQNSSRNENSLGKDNNGNLSSALTFESELYEKLLDSKKFLSKLNALSDHFRKIARVSQEKGEEIELMGIIKNLWRDFYHQMLEIITQKINPCLLYRIPEQIQLPEELAVFSVTQYSKISSQKLNQYKKQLETFRLNFCELLNKSKSREEKQLIVSYFLGLKANVESACLRQVNMKSQSILELKQHRNRQNKKRAEEQIRQLVLMYLIIQSYNSSWNDQKQGSLPHMLKQINEHYTNSEQFSISIFDHIDQDQQIYQIINSYLDLNIETYRISQPQYIERWQQQLDLLFAPYCSSIRNHQSLKNSLKLLILALIKTKLHSLQSK